MKPACGEEHGGTNGGSKYKPEPLRCVSVSRRGKLGVEYFGCIAGGGGG